MNYVGRVLSNVREFYNEINAATLTGAIDVIVVEQEDGTFTCSPFHVRFGKLGVLRSKEKVVDVEVNGEVAPIHMKLGDAGEAFFVEEVDAEEECPEYLATSPIPTSPLSGSRSFNLPNVSDGDFSPPKIDSGHDVNLPKPTPFEKVDASVQTEDEVDGEDTLAEDEKTASNTTGVKPEQHRRKKKRRDLNRRRSMQHDNREAIRNGATGEVEIFDMEDVRENIGLGRSATALSLESWDTENHRNRLEKMSHSLGPGFHFFSDTEISPPSSPLASRPSTPVQSDSEYELKRQTSIAIQTEEEQSWRWGELPSPPKGASVQTGRAQTSLDDHISSGNDVTDTNDKQTNTQEEKRSMLGNVFSFMRKTKKLRHTNEGVYLDDLNQYDPEIAALYFPAARPAGGLPMPVPNSKDEDTESGNGASLPQSPNSVEGAIGGPRHLDSDSEDSRHYCMLDQQCYSDMALSLCGCPGNLSDIPTELFLQSLVTYDQFIADPYSILHSPDLVMRLGGRLYPFPVASSMVMCALLFQRPLPENVVMNLITGHENNVSKKPSQKSKERSSSYSWFSWGRSDTTKTNKNALPAASNEAEENTKNATTETASTPVKEEVINVETTVETPSSTSETEVVEKDPNHHEQYHYAASGEDSEGSEKDLAFTSEKYKKSLRLTSEQIWKLNLKEGQNEFVFSVTTAYQGTTKCKCHIYRWRYDDRIVISDIDGTITKSDVLGHILPIIGRDWAQSGVAQLFTKIKNNGYKLLYLSARAIGQAHVTREYLRSIKQDDLYLPEGPLLLNPTSLINAFHREVIEKKPEEFKISCLRDIQALFVGCNNPFYAGYGNKINDVWAYSAVGIPISRIFTINHRGELKHELTQTFQSSYAGQSYMVNDIFPTLQCLQSNYVY